MKDQRTIRHELLTVPYIESPCGKQMRLGQPTALEVSYQDGAFVIEVEYEDVTMSYGIPEDELLQLRD